MLQAAYNLLWYPALPFALLASHPGEFGATIASGWGAENFRPARGAPRIWIHASSVGEIEAVRRVANGLLEHNRGTVLAITTMTATGRDRSAAANSPTRAHGCSRHSIRLARFESFIRALSS